MPLLGGQTLFYDSTGKLTTCSDDCCEGGGTGGDKICYYLWEFTLDCFTGASRPQLIQTICASLASPPQPYERYAKVSETASSCTYRGWNRGIPNDNPSGFTCTTLGDCPQPTASIPTGLLIESCNKCINCQCSVYREGGPGQSACDNLLCCRGSLPLRASISWTVTRNTTGVGMPPFFNTTVLVGEENCFDGTIQFNCTGILKCFGPGQYFGAGLPPAGTSDAFFQDGAFAAGWSHGDLTNVSCSNITWTRDAPDFAGTLSINIEQQLNCVCSEPFGCINIEDGI